MAMSFTLVCFCLLSPVYFTSFADASDVRSRILTNILMSYDVLLSPKPDGEPIRVTVGIAVKHIGHVDEKEGEISIFLWLYQNWIDQKLQWNQTNYNMSAVFLSREFVWLPETVVYKGINIQEQISRDVLVEKDGEITEARSVQVTLPCTRSTSGANSSSDNRNGQVALSCPLILGCWIAPAHFLTYEPGITDLNSFNDDELADWDLHSVTPSSSIEMMPCFGEPFSVVKFNIILVRDADINEIPYQLVAPSILTSLTATGVFFLPPLAGERITMAGLAFTGQLLLVGFSVLSQLETNSNSELHQLMLFCTLFVFLIIVVVPLSFLLFPLMKKNRIRKGATDQEDMSELLTAANTNFLSRMPDIILFVIFLLIFCVGMAIIFS